MHSIKPFKNEIVLKKIIKKFTSFLFWNPISFYGNCYEKQEESGTNYQSVFRLSNKFSFSRDPSPDHFGCLIQRGLIMSFQKLQLIIYANNFMMLWLPHFWLTPETLKCWTRMRKIKKIWILQEPKERLTWN